MFRSFIVICVVLLAVEQISAQNLSARAANDDLKYLYSQLKELHPGLDRYTSRDSMDYFFKSREAAEGLTELELFTHVRFLISKVRCGHTNASLPMDQYNKFVRERRFLPLMVGFSGADLYITNADLTDGKLNAGDQILSINGKGIDQVVSTIFQHLPSDGFVKTGKYRYVENFFYYYHHLFVDDQNSFTVEVRNTDGDLKSAEISGVELKEVEALRVPDNEPLMSIVHETDHSLMRIRTFSSSALNQQGINYERFLSQSFDELKKRGVKNLILDLRGNGGGDDNYGATLVSYFADRPFRYFDNIQVTDSYDGYGRMSEKGDVRYMTSHKGLDEWKPQKNRFSGKVIVLTDGFSFSTCADVAAVLHHNKWATFVGEETGGGYDGNTSGSTQTITLPNSRIQVRIPMWMYTTANVGHKFHGRGVIPDFAIQYGIEDLLSDRDPVMKKALELIK